jgi:pyruvate dehydrogenase E1 component
VATQGGPVVHLAGTGAVLPEVLLAAAELRDEGIAAHVVDITSMGRLYREWQLSVRGGIHAARVPRLPSAIAEAFVERAPVVTVHDAASHAMAWLGSALGAPCVSIGVDSFGQSGSVPELYELFDLRSDTIVNAALSALALHGSL